MDKKISLDDRIFIAGSNGMAGKAINKSLKKAGYGSIKQKRRKKHGKHNMVPYKNINNNNKLLAIPH